MIQFYEDDLDEVLDVESFKKVGDQLGFNQSETLYKLLDISVEEYNEKYNDMDKGIIEIAKKMKIV